MTKGQPGTGAALEQARIPACERFGKGAWTLKSPCDHPSKILRTSSTFFCDVAYPDSPAVSEGSPTSE